MRLHTLIALAFVALTAVITFPQIAGFADSVPYHSDPYFSMWRLGWVAHAIRTNPRALFDANIFYPERGTLAYSDAILLPGIVLAPFFWARFNPVVLYNAVLFAAFALSGYTAFLLARSLTGCVTAAVIAGVIYAFAPYHFTHYMHLELQLVFWIPLALLLLHRIVDHGRGRDGILLGLTMAAQLLSSIYIGIFAIVYFVVLMPVLLAITGFRHARRVVLPLALGAIVMVPLVVPYALAYVRAEGTVGARGPDEVKIYSASRANYLSAPPMNRLYGWTAVADPIRADEMNLFPGVVAVVLALVGIVGGKGRIRFAYLAGLVAAGELTRGSNSAVYLWLFEHVRAFQGLRSPARMDILVNLSLAVLSAYGMAFLLSIIGHRTRRRLASAAVTALLIAEYASSPVLAPAPKPSRVDALLSARPPAVVVELPLLSRKGFWLSLDPIYMYQGIGHFQNMLNGYSGHAPRSFYEMREQMASFPDDRSMAFLRRRHVTYLVVRAGLFEPEERAALLQQLNQRRDLSLEAMWPEGPQGAEAMYALSGNASPDVVIPVRTPDRQPR